MGLAGTDATGRGTGADSTVETLGSAGWARSVVVVCSAAAGPITGTSAASTFVHEPCGVNRALACAAPAEDRAGGSDRASGEARGAVRGETISCVRPGEVGARAGPARPYRAWAAEILFRPSAALRTCSGSFASARRCARTRRVLLRRT